VTASCQRHPPAQVLPRAIQRHNDFALRAQLATDSRHLADEQHHEVDACPGTFSSQEDDVLWHLDLHCVHVPAQHHVGVPPEKVRPPSLRFRSSANDGHVGHAGPHVLERQPLHGLGCLRVATTSRFNVALDVPVVVLHKPLVQVDVKHFLARRHILDKVVDPRPRREGQARFVLCCLRGLLLRAVFWGLFVLTETIEGAIFCTKKWTAFHV